MSIGFSGTLWQMQFDDLGRDANKIVEYHNGANAVVKPGGVTNIPLNLTGYTCHKYVHDRRGCAYGSKVGTVQKTFLADPAEAPKPALSPRR